MDLIDTSLPELSKLLEQRLALLRILADSLEASSLAMAQNDAEAIAHGAAHQAELCLQWSRLEDQLRREASRHSAPSAGASGTARLQAEWEALGTRIRYLTRVHWSLLRHLQRSLAVMNRVVDSCALTYTPGPGSLRTELRTEVRLVSRECAGE
ncbi:MAG TPA: hypothetical protein VJW96_08785 [Terriglobales bacterium]|jgi:hypothetical protein|nr:hypothetical protein [Terriglobales bacterium]